MKISNKINTNIPDPEIITVISKMRNNENVWNKRLLESNGIKKAPSAEEVVEALNYSRSDESKEFDEYAKKMSMLAFRNVIRESDRGDFWKKLGFNLNAAIHFAKAAEIAYRHGVPDWPSVLIDQAEKAYAALESLTGSGPHGLDEKIKDIKKRIFEG
jgi:hypothetical protein